MYWTSHARARRVSGHLWSQRLGWAGFRCGFALVWSCLAGIGWGQEAALIRVGEVWRYTRGTVEPAGAPGAWTQLNYPEEGWSEGLSGFSHGFGDEYGEPTRLPDFGQNYVSLLGRKTFVVTNRSELTWPSLRVDYNDGFVAYLNGVEVVRRNLPGQPGEPVSVRAYAMARHARGDTEEIDLRAVLPLLREGTNVLAFQVHTSGALDWNFAFVPELLNGFVRGPLVQNLSSNRVELIWRTPGPTEAVVVYGTTPELGQRATGLGPSRHHQIRLEGLQPDTEYFYRVQSRHADGVIESAGTSFRTLKTEGALSFVVVGDTGTGSAEQYAVARQMEQLRPDLVFHVGDIVYPLLTVQNVDARCFSVYQPHMQRTPYFFAIGNHDLYGGDPAYLESFALPTNAVTGTSHFYSFDHGDAHFVVLLQPYASQYLLTVGDRQHQWLTNDLAQTRKPWKFLFMHVPMLTSGSHRFDDFARFGTADRLEILSVLMPLVAQHEVTMVFAGHDHNYERFSPLEGMNAIVTGGGGVKLRWLSELDRASSQFRLEHHCVRVVIEGDRLELQAVNQAGEVFDTMVRHRAVSSAERLWESAWATPVVEDAGADDLDGNIHGQRFDFVEGEIPTRAGRWSNLGRFYVHNDRTHLYLGLRDVMIQGEDSVFLFLEVPGLLGVRDLGALGNGMLDPEGEGVDGLDFLDHLSFTNFAPNVGLILGDELADGTLRSYRRLSSTLDTGQGAFYLEPGLPEILGVRLQQFNRERQTGGVPLEENADFIEIAIPYTSLGSLRPGQTIRVGGVVGLGSALAEGPPWRRRFDSGYLGSQWTGDGDAPSVLSSVTVVLAEDLEADVDGDGLSLREERRVGTDAEKADTDGDGLSDGFEERYGLAPLDASGGLLGPEGDPDSDGLVNLREQFLGTDPRDARSVVWLTVDRSSVERLLFSWPTVPGRRYQLESSQQLGGPYTNVAARVFPWTAASTNQVFDQPLWPAGQGQFFRVRVLE